MPGILLLLFLNLACLERLRWRDERLWLVGKTKSKKYETRHYAFVLTSKVQKQVQRLHHHLKMGKIFNCKGIINRGPNWFCSSWSSFLAEPYFDSSICSWMLAVILDRDLLQWPWWSSDKRVGTVPNQWSCEMLVPMSGSISCPWLTSKRIQHDSYLDQRKPKRCWKKIMTMSYWQEKFMAIPCTLQTPTDRTAEKITIILPIFFIIPSYW